ncbi:MAG: hypothetical protein LBS57_00820 [Treponema sp.]|jgi:hypothetical protein|nr:hypothetical protein [Treponema sp.]
MRSGNFLLCVTIIAAAAFFSGCEPETGGGNYPETLAGTKWEWDSEYGLRTLDFDSADHLVFYNDRRDGAEPARFDDYYTYDSSTGTGTVTGAYPAGDFALVNDNRVMYFKNFKAYGHGADFTRIE